MPVPVVVCRMSQNMKVSTMPNQLTDTLLCDPDCRSYLIQTYFFGIQSAELLNCSVLSPHFMEMPKMPFFVHLYAIRD